MFQLTQEAPLVEAPLVRLFPVTEDGLARPPITMGIDILGACLEAEGFDRYISFIDADFVARDNAPCGRGGCAGTIVATGWRHEALRSYRAFTYCDTCGRVVAEF